MKLITLILVTLMLLACGPKHYPADEQPSPKDVLKTKYSLYKDLSRSQADSKGHIMTDECDSVLFSGLYGTTMPVELTLARDSNGMWHRRALNYPECYPTDSSSTISRDMLLGVMWYALVNNRLDIAEDLFEYGKSHDWIMGQGDISRIYFTPGLQATLAELVYRLGGENHRSYRSIPQTYSKNIGFAAHLDILHILLRAELEGFMPDSAFQNMEYNYERSPKNPLFSYAHHKFTDGDQTETINFLLNSSLFPADRLPTTHDRCEPWLTQRDPGKDWEPCGLDSVPKTHSGGDLLFVARLVLRN